MIFVLGANGQLGAEFRQRYPEFKYFTKKELLLSEYTWDYYKREIEKSRPDTVINCAAYTKVDLAENEIEKAVEVNSIFVRRLADYSRIYKYRLVHFSTDYVFDGAKDSPYTENDATSPLSIYGKSKEAGEKHVVSLGLGGIVIRTSWLYGHSGINFVQKILDKLERGESLKIVNDQIGSPTYAGDLVEATVNLIGQGRYGLFHFCNSGHSSWYEFATRIRDLRNFKNEISPILTASLNLPAARPLQSILDCTLYKTKTGKQIRSWESALEEYLKE